MDLHIDRVIRVCQSFGQSGVAKFLATSMWSVLGLLFAAICCTAMRVYVWQPDESMTFFLHELGTASSVFSSVSVIWLLLVQRAYLPQSLETLGLVLLLMMLLHAAGVQVWEIMNEGNDCPSWFIFAGFLSIVTASLYSGLVERGREKE